MRVRVAICGVFIALWAVIALFVGRDGLSGRARAEGENKVSRAKEPGLEGACPAAQWVGASPWSGLLPQDPNAPQRRLCGRQARWTFVRMKPQASEIELFWESPEALQLAVGWGSCSSRARLCPEHSPLPLSFWSEGAPLWVAIAPSRSEAPQEDESDSSTQKSEGKSDAKARYLPISIGWRRKSTPSP